MSKYSSLGDFLRKQRGDHVALTFGKIEEVIDGKLPRSARYSAWWSNNPTNNVMTKVWLAAGFKSEQVDISARKVVFRRAEAPAESTGPATIAQTGATKPFHPLFGVMKGLIKIAPGVDITEPADPDWAKLYD